MQEIPATYFGSKVHTGLMTISNEDYQEKTNISTENKQLLNMWETLCMVATLTHGTDKWLSRSCGLQLYREGAGHRNP